MVKRKVALLSAFGICVILAATLTGCGAKASPQANVGGTGADTKQGVQGSGAAVVKAGTTWENAVEPDAHKIGGIPAADLTLEPKYGGTLIHGSNGFTKNDPFFATGPYNERWPVRLYANGLLEWDLKCNCPRPELAESWTQVDDTTYDFKLRQDVHFQKVAPVNGRLMTAEDVKWSFDRIAGLGDKPKGIISINYARFSTVKEFQIKDPKTVRLILNQPDSMILREIMYDFTVVMPKEAMIDGFFNDPKSLIGTGPFIVEDQQAVGQSRYKKNPDYWKKDAKGRQLPYLDAVYSMGNADPAPTQAALKTGQAHIILLPYAYGKVFENDSQFRIYNTANSMVGTSGMWMNTKMKPFDDVRVRRAVNLGIDREETGKAVWGPGGYYNLTFLGTWEPYTWSQQKISSLPGYALTGPAKQKEYEEAKQLLAEAGYPNGFEFTCECENVPKTEVLVEQMKRIGLKVIVHKVTSTDMRWQAYMKDKQFANAIMGGGHTPDYSIQQYFLCDAAKNLSQVCDPKIEQWFKDFRATTDQAKQVEILGKVQDFLQDLMPVANDHRGVYYFIGFNWVHGWRNPMYECCWAHGEQLSYMWIDKK